MTSTAIGLNMKYLPWQLFVPIMFGFSIGCIYFGVTTKGKSKTINMICYCSALAAFLMGLESLAINTGILAQCLPFLSPIYYSILGVILILIFFFL